MKTKTICFMALFALFFSISMAGAAQYTVLNYPGRTGNGGPFIIDPVGPGANFYSFCLEKDEYISLGSTYYGTIDSAALYGGNYIDYYGGTGSSSTTTDPLEIQTKKLYNYAIDNWTTLDIANLTAIQWAIWAYEAEVRLSSLSDLAIKYYNEADSFGLNRNIMVLNLWTRDASAPYADDWNYKRQSQLIEVPVPEPVTLILLGFGLVGLICVSKKLNKGIK